MGSSARLLPVLIALVLMVGGPSVFLGSWSAYNLEPGGVAVPDWGSGLPWAALGSFGGGWMMLGSMLLGGGMMRRLLVMAALYVLVGAVLSTKLGLEPETLLAWPVALANDLDLVKTLRK